MGEGIVLYQSKYGTTKRYAGWISEELGCDLLEIKQAKIETILGYDPIIFGGGIYASGIAGINFLKKNIDKLCEKRVIVFAVGASPANPIAIDELKKRNMPGKLTKIPLFYCRGAWKESAMTLEDRMLCNILKKSVSKKDPQQYEPWEEALMQSTGSDVDWTDISYINPIIEYALS